MFLRDFLGLTARTEMRMILRWGPFVDHFSGHNEPLPLSRTERISFYVFATLVIAALWHFNVWLEFLILWLIPLTPMLMPFIRMRTVTEHVAIPGRTGDNATRHVDGTWLERVLIAPCNINFHVAHHLFAAVPLYNLPRFHKHLLKVDEFRDYVAHKDSYFGRDGATSVFGEVISKVDRENQPSEHDEVPNPSVS